jgi:hypothetical protein
MSIFAILFLCAFNIFSADTDLIIHDSPKEEISHQNQLFISNEEELIEVIRRMSSEFERFNEIENYIQQNVGKLKRPNDISSALTHKYMQLFKNKIEWWNILPSKLGAGFFFASSAWVFFCSRVNYLLQNNHIASTQTIVSQLYLTIGLGITVIYYKHWKNEKKLKHLLMSLSIYPLGLRF